MIMMVILIWIFEKLRWEFYKFLSDSVKDGSPRPNSGRPGIDYPIFHKIPETSFSCKEQRYKGFFGDPETGCQVIFKFLIFI